MHFMKPKESPHQYLHEVALVRSVKSNMISKKNSFVCVSGLFVIVVGVEAYNKVLEKNRYRYQPIVCTNDDCRTMANVILATMNKTVDPCEDFYEFACGAWIHSNATLPANRATWNRVAMVEEKVANTLREILESKDYVEEPVEKAKQWYRSCMYEENLEMRGIQPLTSLANAVGGWPVAMALGHWNPSDYTWQEIELYYSRIMGSYAMYDFAVSINTDNGSMKAISLKGPRLPLSEFIQVPRHYCDPEDRESYAKLVAGVARAFATAQGARVSGEKMAREVNDMIEFEIKLDRIKDDDTISLDSIATIQQFLDQYMPHAKISKINLFKLIQNMVEAVGGIGITEEEVVSVRPLYLVALSLLLNETSFRTIVNYVHWRYLSRMLHATNSEMLNLLVEFERETLGIREPLPRWVQCVNGMKLNHALSYQFVQGHFTEDTYNSASGMISTIQSELERRINGSTWMDDETKEAWKEKLWNVRALIGFPDWYNNVTNLVEYYEELTIGNDYFNNLLNYMKFEARKSFQTLRSTDGQPEWLSDPITVNAIYIITANSLNIPAANFQPPLFTPMMPDAVKYGIIGSMLGHELSHGFDDTGFRFDKDGIIIDWPEDTMTVYSQRTRCFIEQYNNLTNSSIFENIFFGPRTVDENIADTTGVQSVLGAYKSVVRGNIRGDRKLPGLEQFSNEQLLFLSYATIWCEMSTPKYARKKLIAPDSHSSSRVRVLATMSNIEGFAEAFNCPEGSAMNPAKKCNIWTGAPTPESKK